MGLVTNRCFGRFMFAADFDLFYLRIDKLSLILRSVRNQCLCNTFPMISESFPTVKYLIGLSSHHPTETGININLNDFITC